MSCTGSHTAHTPKSSSLSPLSLSGPGLPQVAKLRAQVEEQETSLKAQEEEVMSKRQELTDLKNQETQLEERVTQMKKRIDELSITQQETQLHISQVFPSYLSVIYFVICLFSFIVIFIVIFIVAFLVVFPFLRLCICHNLLFQFCVLHYLYCHYIIIIIIIYIVIIILFVTTGNTETFLYLL